MENDNDLTATLTQALQDIKKETGEDFSLETVNLAELQRRTGISRAKLRRLKANNFKEVPHGLTGRKASKTVISGYESVINDQLRQGGTNSVNIYDKLKEVGYVMILALDLCKGKQPKYSQEPVTNFFIELNFYSSSFPFIEYLHLV